MCKPSHLPASALQLQSLTREPLLTARVSGNQQALGSAIDGFAHRTPPSARMLSTAKVGPCRGQYPRFTQPRFLPTSVDAIRSDPSQLGNDEIMYPAPASGSPLSRSSRPPFLKSPTNSSSWYPPDDRLTLPQERRTLRWICSN